MPSLCGKEAGMTKAEFLSRVEADRLAKAKAKREAESAVIYYYSEKKHKRACAKKRRIYG